MPSPFSMDHVFICLFERCFDVQYEKKGRHDCEAFYLIYRAASAAKQTEIP